MNTVTYVRHLSDRRHASVRDLLHMEILTKK
jgi:hypothetical protein